MKSVLVGGGPAGLYLAILIKKAGPAHQVTVLERNRPDDTFGWGVVFSDQTLENFRVADEPSYRQITDRFAHWDDIDIHVKGQTITSGGHGFSGIARRTLLAILQQRAVELGAELRFQCEVVPGRSLETIPGAADADLIVAADGVNSAIRRRYADAFKPDLDVRSARFIWLGTTYKFDAFTFYFVQDENGVFQAHCYRFDDDYSTFIVECDEASWKSAGFDRMDLDATIAACEKMFGKWLHGHRLLGNASHQRRAPWLNFVRVSNEHWHYDNIVLIGDAAHTAHFSIGSGTKLAMEDAIGLSRLLGSETSLSAALVKYGEERRIEALRLQNAARNSMEWFENVKRYMVLDPPQFAYSLLTRSQRVSHENLRIRDHAYLSGVERWFAGRSSRHESPPPDTTPPMFTPFKLRDMTLQNRVVVSPMDMYSAVEGTPNELHLVHLGARALGGAGLVMTEMTCVSPEARITLGCTGMYAPDHVDAWRRICSFVHQWSRAKICFQLGHSGRKGSTRLMWEGMDEQLESGNWELMGPSAVPYGPSSQLPREMSHADMDVVLRDFVRSTEMAIESEFDMLELHCAHGYLLSSFITPLSNRRQDEYGGSLANRLRFPLEVFSAMRAAWPAGRPMSVRISATDWVTGEESVDASESVEIARAFGHAGADIIHVSTGQTAAHSKPVYGRMFQTPFSDRIRNETGLPTIAVGNIVDADQVNGIIAAGRADLCAVGRPHLSDPNWTLHAAAELRYSGAGVQWPVQYLAGKQQLERTLARQAEMRGTSTI